jgi:hypothetical protein
MIKPAFTTLTQCKEILNITTTDYDLLLPKYLKQVNSFLLAKYGWLNDEYLLDQVCTVENSDEFIVECIEGIDIENTFVVDGQGNTLYIVDEIDVDEKRLYTNYTGAAITEATIRLRILDLGAKTIACQMAFWMTLKSNANEFGVQQLDSERIGNYSYNLSDSAKLGVGGYPAEYLNGLELYKKYRFDCLESECDEEEE